MPQGLSHPEGRVMELGEMPPSDAGACIAPFWCSAARCSVLFQHTLRRISGHISYCLSQLRGKMNAHFPGSINQGGSRTLPAGMFPVSKARNEIIRKEAQRSPTQAVQVQGFLEGGQATPTRPSPFAGTKRGTVGHSPTPHEHWPLGLPSHLPCHPCLPF